MIGVQEEIERLTKRVEEAEEVMLGASNLGRQLDRLEVCLKKIPVIYSFVSCLTNIFFLFTCAGAGSTPL